VKQTIIVGIDGGSEGAFVFLDLKGDVLEVVDMPFIQGMGVNCKTIRDMFIAKQELYEIRAGFELCHPDNKMNSRAAFSFGKNLQAVETVLQMMDINIMYFTPQEWQKHFSLIGKNKRDNCILAYKMQPKFQDSFIYTHNKRTVYKDGRADAYLIGEYARRKYNY